RAACWCSRGRRCGWSRTSTSTRPASSARSPRSGPSSVRHVNEAGLQVELARPDALALATRDHAVEAVAHALEGEAGGDRLAPVGADDRGIERHRARPHDDHAVRAQIGRVREPPELALHRPVQRPGEEHDERGGFERRHGMNLRPGRARGNWTLPGSRVGANWWKPQSAWGMPRFRMVMSPFMSAADVVLQRFPLRFSGWLTLAACLVAVALIAFADHLTGYEMRLAILYLGP